MERNKCTILVVAFPVLVGACECRPIPGPTQDGPIGGETISDGPSWREMPPRETPLPELPPVCGWSKMAAPFGVTAALSRVWGSGPSDVFAVGEAGTIIHYDGRSWIKMDAPPAGSWNGIWGSSASDVFAVGVDCAVAHYDGKVWSSVSTGVKMPSCGLFGVWGSSPTDLYAVGQTVVGPRTGPSMVGLRLHYDGTSWTASAGPEGFGGTYYHDIWGTGPDNVYVVGLRQNQGLIMHYDGSSWSDAGGTYLDWRPYRITHSVWGTGPADVYASGEILVHYDGKKWSKALNQWVRGGWSSSPNDVFVAGKDIFHFDGSSWTSIVQTPTPLSGMWGSGPKDVFAVGQGATILHYSCSR